MLVKRVADPNRDFEIWYKRYRPKPFFEDPFLSPRGYLWRVEKPDHPTMGAPQTITVYDKKGSLSGRIPYVKAGRHPVMLEIEMLGNLEWMTAFHLVMGNEFYLLHPSHNRYANPGGLLARLYARLRDNIKYVEERKISLYGISNDRYSFYFAVGSGDVLIKPRGMIRLKTKALFVRLGGLFGMPILDFYKMLGEEYY